MPLLRTATVAVLAALAAATCTNPEEPSSPQAAALVVSPDTLRLAPGHSRRLTVYAVDDTGAVVQGVPVVFSSDAPAVATVSNVGLVTAGAVADTTLVRVTGGGVERDVPIIVLSPPARVQVTPDTATIPQGGELQLAATVLDANGDPIPELSATFISSNPPIATVTAGGLVHGGSTAGTVVIEAQFDSLRDSARIVVTDTLLGDRVSLPGRPYGAAISVNDVAYVGQLDLASLARANLPSHTFAAAASVGSTPTEVAFNSTGTRAYVTNQGNRSVAVVDVATNGWIDTIPTTGDPFEVIVPPGDSIVYVTTNVDSVYGNPALGPRRGGRLRGARDGQWLRGA